MTTSTSPACLESDLGEYGIERITRLHYRQRFAGFDEGGEQQAQEFVAAVYGENALGVDAVDQSGKGAEIVGQGRGVTPQIGAFDGAQGFDDGGRRRVGILVGIKLDDFRRIRLFAGRVALHSRDVFSFK